MSVNLLGTVHVFVSGSSVCDCVAQHYYVTFIFIFDNRYLFCTTFRSVPVTGK